MIRTIVIAALLVAAAFGASHAGAQEMYQSSVPMDKDVLKAMPEFFHVDFGQAIHVKEVKILGADNTEWPTDWKFTDDDSYEVKFRSLKALPPGDYQMEWSAYVRQHFHPDAGTIRFRIQP